MGLLLVAGGTAVLLRNLGFWRMSWHDAGTWGLTAVGALILFVAYSQRSRGKVFLGSLIFLYGIVRFLVDLRIIHPFLTEVWPLYLVIFGGAFAALYPIGPRDVATLIVGLLFVSTGLFLFATENRYFPGLSDILVSQLWPVILILFGAVLLLLSFLRRPDARLGSGGRSAASVESDKPAQPEKL